MRPLVVGSRPHLIPVILLALTTAEGVIRTLWHHAYDWKAYWAALGNAVVRNALRYLPLGLATPTLGFIWQHRLLQVPPHGTWSLAILFLGVEFCYYWFHRASHTVRWFWASHAVHHAPNDLSLAVAHQLGWTGALSGALLFYAPMVWLGFHPNAVLGVLTLNLLYQFWLHSRWLPKLGPIEWFLNTPSHHRVHHACNPEYLGPEQLGANYGGVLIVFDRLFGTYIEERADLPCRYGLVKRLVSYNPFYVAFHEWIAMARDVGASRNWRVLFLTVFGVPGWKPIHGGRKSIVVSGLLMLCGSVPALADEPFSLEDVGRSIGVAYYTPTQDHRDIDVTAIDFSRGWKIWRVFELQRRVGLFHAQGNRTDAPNGVNPDSTATGVDLGAAARLYFLDMFDVRRLHPYLEGSAQFLFTPGTHEGFPSGGSGVNGFLRAGAGVVLQLGPRLAIDANYQWYSHVSNGTGLTPQNPMWNGHGGTVAVRRMF